MCCDQEIAIYRKGYSVENLSTDFKDDILHTSVNVRPKYQMVNNPDGTVSFIDVTSYAQTGTQFGAKEIIEERIVINELLQSVASLKTYVDSKLDELKTTMKNEMFPVGTIVKTVRNVNPSTYLGGTWVAWGTGRVPVGVDTSQTEFNAVEKTGGEKTVKLGPEDIPEHSHFTNLKEYVKNGFVFSTGEGDSFAIYEPPASAGFGLSVQVDNPGAGVTTGTAGDDMPHNNLPPYITCYMWKRTA